MKTLILLEGPDFAGKTTWAQHIMSNWPDVAYFKAVASTTVDDYIHAITDCTESTLIMDRCWLSDAIYAPILRKETYTEEAFLEVHRTMIQELKKLGCNVMILFTPIHVTTMQSRYAKRGDPFLTEAAVSLKLSPTELFQQIIDGYDKFFSKQSNWNYANWPIVSAMFIN